MYNEIIRFAHPNLLVRTRSVECGKNKNLIGLHFHNAIELVRCDRGKCSCVIADSELLLSEGEIILVNSKVLHCNQFASDDSVITYMQIDVDKYAQQFVSPSERYFYQFLGNRNLTDYKIFSPTSSVRRIFDEMEGELEQERASFESFIKADVQYLIAVMQREGLMLDYNELADKSTLARIMPAVHYAEENYRNKIVLSELCSQINMDKYYFCKLFKKSVGATYSDFVGFLRLANAERLLLSTDKTVFEIAYECGFGTIQYFNRAFKARNGCTPKEYRKLNLPHA